MESVKTLHQIACYESKGVVGESRHPAIQDRYPRQPTLRFWPSNAPRTAPRKAAMLIGLA